MTYSIMASGGTADEETEKMLHAELAEVLAKPEYGCSGSSFSGTYVQGTIHQHKSPGTGHVHEQTG